MGNQNSCERALPSWVDPMPLVLMSSAAVLMLKVFRVGYKEKSSTHHTCGLSKSLLGSHAVLELASVHINFKLPHSGWQVDNVEGKNSRPACKRVYLRPKAILLSPTQYLGTSHTWLIEQAQERNNQRPKFIYPGDKWHGTPISSYLSFGDTETHEGYDTGY